MPCWLWRYCLVGLVVLSLPFTSRYTYLGSNSTWIRTNMGFQSLHDNVGNHVGRIFVFFLGGGFPPTPKTKHSSIIFSSQLSSVLQAKVCFPVFSLIFIIPPPFQQIMSISDKPMFLSCSTNTTNQLFPSICYRTGGELYCTSGELILMLVKCQICLTAKVCVSSWCSFLHISTKKLFNIFFSSIQ